MLIIGEMIDANTAVSLGIIAVVLAVLGFVATIHYRQSRLESSMDALQNQVGRLETDLREELRAMRVEFREELRGEIQREGQVTRGEIKRLLDALTTHEHDADGQVVFRIPPSGD